MEVQIQRFSINDIVNYKTPINYDCWGKIIEISRIENSILADKIGNILYKVKPFNNELGLDTIEQTDVKEAYSIYFNKNNSWEE